MVAMLSCRHPGMSASQVFAKRQLRKHLRKIREREYCNLRALVPAVASKKKVTKVQVIEEAVKYIEELHAALMERFKLKHGNKAQDKAQETVQTFVSRMVSQSRTSSNPSTITGSVPPLNILCPNSLDKQRNQSSFLLRRRERKV